MQGIIMERKRKLENDFGNGGKRSRSESPRSKTVGVEGRERRGGSPSAITSASDLKHFSPRRPQGPKRRKIFDENQRLRKNAVRDFGGWDPALHTKVQPVSNVQPFGSQELSRNGYRIQLEDSLALESGDASEFAAKGEAILAYGLQYIIGLFGADDVGQVIIRNENLHGNGFLSTKWQSFASLSYKDVLAKFVEAKNSEDLKGNDRGIRLEDTEFQFLQVKKPSYGGRSWQDRAHRQGTLEKWVSQNQSTVNPSSAKYSAKVKANKWCLILACVLGEIRENNPGKPAVYYKKRQRQTCQTSKRASEIVAGAGLPFQGPHQVSDLKSIQQFLGPDFQICAYEESSKPIVRYGEDDAEKHINIWLMPGRDGEEGQAYLITKMARFVAPSIGRRAREFCELCKSAFDPEKKHRCISRCSLCGNPRCGNLAIKDQAWNRRQLCHYCRHPFWTPQCLQAHITYDQKICSKNLKCRFCEKIYSQGKEKNHNCGLLDFCDTCKVKKATFDHVCYIQKNKAKRRTQARKRWYGDIESFVDPKGLHHPNLLILKSHENNSAEGMKRVYRGLDCVQKFIRDTEHESEKPSVFFNSYILFHNLGGYDGHFILQELLKEPGLNINLIRKGSSIMSMELKGRKIIFRDSLRFIPARLAEFPKIFGFETHKGHFPHKCNTLRHLKEEMFMEEGERFPPQRYFEPGKMSVEGAAEFELWWETEKKRFDADLSLRYVVREELERYCSLDVDVLMLGFECFLQDAEEKHPTVDVLAAMTSPSFCNKAFVEEDMVKDSIALLPPDGFKPAGQGYSLDELAWLAWQRRQLGLTLLRHNRNFRTIRIAGFQVDGYGKDEQGNAFVFEYDGCFFHGCKCRRTRVDKKDMAESRRVKTEFKHKRLEEIGADPASPYGFFTFISIKECEFKLKQKTDSKMKEFVLDYKRALGKEPLSLKKSFFGGRTTPIMHRCDSDKNREIGYADFTSLYPAVNACNREGEAYPVGYPTILLGTEVKERFGDDIANSISTEKLFGVVFCEMLPPKQLRHGVIPVRVNKKLLFPLCRTCAEEEQQESCAHSPAQRRLTVHLPTPELRKALQKGYRLGRVFEAWHFEQRSHELLRPYIVKHYKDKEYASGFPDDVKSAEEKQAHAQACSDALFGEPFDCAKFQKNSGKRTLHKGMLNNFWGFFGKKEDHTSCEVISDLESWKRLLYDKEREIKLVDVTPDGKHLMVDHKPVVERVGKKTSRLIASFTTSLARLRLYQVLEAHSDEIIYMDTDSVFYFKSASNPGPRTPGTLGELKDEIAAAYPPGAYIGRMTCTAPKSYVYVVFSAEGKIIGVQIRLKGITVTNGNKPLFDDMELRRLQDEPEKRILVPQMVFDKDKNKQTITTRDYEKTLRYISSKRRHIPNSSRFDTLPYGFVDKI